jgi:hypothetical protein
MAALTPDERKALARKAVQTDGPRPRRKTKSLEVRGIGGSDFSN